MTGAPSLRPCGRRPARRTRTGSRCPPSVIVFARTRGSRANGSGGHRHMALPTSVGGAFLVSLDATPPRPPRRRFAPLGPRFDPHADSLPSTHGFEFRKSIKIVDLRDFDKPDSSFFARRPILRLTEDPARGSMPWGPDGLCRREGRRLSTEELDSRGPRRHRRGERA